MTQRSFRPKESINRTFSLDRFLPKLFKGSEHGKKKEKDLWKQEKDKKWFKREKIKNKARGSYIDKTYVTNMIVVYFS